MPTFPLRARQAALAVTGASAALLALGSPALAANVPVSAQLVAKPVLTPSVSGANTSPPVVHPLRVRNEAQYEAAKAAANLAYNRWGARHSLTESPFSSVGIVSLDRFGIPASQGGGSTPPDSTGAAGPNYYLEFANSRISVYNRSTLASPPVRTATEDAFVGSTQTCDGQIKWDRSAWRYEYYSLDCGASPGAEGFTVGWSKTGIPTNLASGWCKYHFATGTALYDYGKLGNSSNYLIVGANQFDDSSGSYVGSPIVVIPKPANGVTTCPGLSATVFNPSSANEYTPEPANVYGWSAAGYVVAISGSLNNALRLYTVTKGTSTPVVTDRGNVTVPAFSTPASVPQPSPAPAADVLDSSDTRLTQANAVVDPTLKTFGIWTQHTVAGAAGGPSVVRWYEVEVGRRTPVQTGTVAVPGEFAFNGAISPTTAGSAAAINYNVGGGNLLVQLRARIHVAGSAAGSTSNDTLLARSRAVDVDFSCPSVTGGNRPCRWGDYAGASFDPLNSKAVFGTNQYNGALQSGNQAQWLTNNFRLLTP